MSAARTAVTVIVSIVVAAAVVSVFLFLVQRRLVYLPDHDVGDPPAGIETVEFKTRDGISHEAWVASPVMEPIATVLVFNGNAGDRADRLPLAEALTAEGLEVVLFDYRGYGDTAGSPSEQGLLADARAAADMVERRAVTPLVYFGESLGAAVAAALAEERPPAAMVLRSPFASLLDVARVHYGPVPGWLLVDRWPVAERVARLRMPILVIAGTDDRIVPLSQSRAVAEAAPDGRLLVIDGGHNDLSLFAGPELAGEIGAFAREVGDG